MTEPRFMTTDEVADLLRTSVETVRYWRHIGKGPKSFKLGRRVLYAVEDIEAFITQARVEGEGRNGTR
jgi:excisionase family DNA binding protein